MGKFFNLSLQISDTCNVVLFIALLCTCVVLWSRSYKQVFWSIVGSYGVQVVNNFARSKRPTKILLHDVSVLKNSFSARKSKDDIATGKNSCWLSIPVHNIVILHCSCFYPCKTHPLLHGVLCKAKPFSYLAHRKTFLGIKPNTFFYDGIGSLCRSYSNFVKKFIPSITAHNHPRNIRINIARLQWGCPPLCLFLDVILEKFTRVFHLLHISSCLHSLIYYTTSV